MKLSDVKGIGPKKEQRLATIGVTTAEDLLHLYPRRYTDRSRLVSVRDGETGKPVTILATVIHLKTLRRPGRTEMLVLSVESDGMIGEMVFFNATYMKRMFRFQESYYFHGKLERAYGKFKMVHPEFAHGDDPHFLTIEPVYSLPEGIGQRDFRRWVRMVLDSPVEERLSQSIVDSRHLCSREYALRNIHFPTSREGYKEAKYRLVYEEFLRYMLGNQLIRGDRGQERGLSVPLRQEAVEEFLEALPFTMTQDQTKVVSEIQEDLTSDRKMMRLLQGDVGSGKTVVAALAIWQVIDGGHQAALMAPTDVLARQHYETLRNLLPERVRMVLLTGRTPDKPRLVEDLEKGRIDLAVGTHALIQPQVRFRSLALMVTDEQHRFGVRQRQELLDRHPESNYLMMSATPIPRTMAMILYSDVDLSTIRTLPAGRKPIETRIGMDEALIKQLMAAGQQGYAVYPLIGDSEHLEDVTSAERGLEEMQARFPDRRIALVHGRMKDDERDRTLSAFRRGEIDLLVSTTVIEVGIDVANASFILIHDAERFGLSQLHQLRGRVGRGQHKSYCFLVTNQGREENQRLAALVESQDGFVISRRDLEIRGPGEMLGLRQHGTDQFLIADFFRHEKILKQAAEDVRQVLDNPTEHGALLEATRKDLRRS